MLGKTIRPNMPRIYPVEQVPVSSSGEPILSFDGQLLLDAADIAINHDYPHDAYDELLDMLLEMKANFIRIDELIVIEDFQGNEGNFLVNIATYCIDNENVFDEICFSLAQAADVTHDAWAAQLRADVSEGSNMDADSESDSGSDVSAGAMREMVLDDLLSHLGSARSEESDLEYPDPEYLGPEYLRLVEEGDYLPFVNRPDLEAELHAAVEARVRAAVEAALEARRQHAERFVRALPVVDIATIDPEDRQCAVCMDAYLSRVSNMPVRLPCPGRHILGGDCLFHILVRSGTQCPFDRIDVVQIAIAEGWF